MKTRTFNIALPTDLVVRMDVVSKKEYRSRSELIREAVRVYLEDKAQWEEIFSFGEGQAKKLKIKTEEEVSRQVEEYRHGKKNR